MTCKVSEKKRLRSRLQASLQWQHLVWPGLFFLLAGCSAAPDFDRQVRSYSSTIAGRLDTTVTDGVAAASQNEDSQVLTLSFDEACILAARNDGKIDSLVSDFEKSSIDLDSTESNRLPRFHLSANADIPMEDSDDSESDLTGGVYVEYDIWRAVAVKDESVLRQALLSKSRHQLRLELNGIQQRLLRQLGRIRLAEISLQEKQNALDLAEEGCTLARLHLKQQNRSPVLLKEWEGKKETMGLEIDRLSADLAREKHLLSDMLGTVADKEVRISDLAEVLDGQSEAPQTNLKPSQVWDKHSEARLYELELIAAEVALSLVALERLPKLDATFGLGNIPLEGSNVETASSVMSLSLSMPLWDMGDYSRKHAKVMLERDRVKRGLQQKMVRLWNRTLLAAEMFRLSEIKKERLKSAVSKMEKRVTQSRKLVSLGKADSFALLQLELRLLELQVEYSRAVQEYRESAEGYRFAAGLDVLSGQTESMADQLLKRAYVR